MKPALVAPLLLGALALPVQLVSAQALQSPEDFLGRPVAADYGLSDWDEITRYFEHAAQASDRVTLQQVGKTTEGRDLFLAVLGSPENLARLPEIQAASQRLRDPRGIDAAERRKLLEDTPLTLFIACAMHSIEAAAPEFALEMLHLWASSDEEPWVTARRELVVLLAPSLNPDGLETVVGWSRETEGTPYEGAGLVKLYQHYAGHDNNRDWFALSLQETRLVTKLLYQDWNPQVYWDVHQQGQSRERFFVPPYRDPLNPNIDPAIVTGIFSLGMRALHDMTSEGLTGISTGVTYDMWWNGGNRSVPARHGIMGILTEAASPNLAAPTWLDKGRVRAPRGLPDNAPSVRFPAPWPGGWWRLRDVVDYELAFARSLVRNLATDRQHWLGVSLGVAERALETTDGPWGWIIPAEQRDRGGLERLVDILLLSGVEVFVTKQPLVADDRTWPAGSLVLPRAQPHGLHLKDLFELQRYPDGPTPYDVSGWTLPLLLGVDRLEVVRAPKTKSLTQVRTVEAAMAGIKGRDGDGWDARDSATWKRVVAELARGRSLRYRSESVDQASFSTSPGRDGLKLTGLPRVGVYAPWSATKNEGWLRLVLDQHALPYTRLRPEMIRAGSLNRDYDVIVLPMVSERGLEHGRHEGTVPAKYAGGLEPEGAVALERFVKAGGVLVAMEDSAQWCIELFDLPLRDVTVPRKVDGKPEHEFSIPGSVVRAVPEPSVLTGGLGTDLAMFFSRASAWEVGAADEGELEVLLTFPKNRILLSGWARDEHAIAGHAAWVRSQQGDGVVHLFGFRPQYRGWSQRTFQLIMRSLLLERAEAD
ncbi:MAG: M14 family zinc carboxypeptidase [Acidobacteriota bacterium]